MVWILWRIAASTRREELLLEELLGTDVLGCWGVGCGVWRKVGGGGWLGAWERELCAQMCAAHAVFAHIVRRKLNAAHSMLTRRHIKFAEALWAWVCRSSGLPGLSLWIRDCRSESHWIASR